jgi:hypothetical protein
MMELSHISQMLPLLGMKFISFTKDKWIFGWFILFSSLVAFLDIQMVKAGIPHLWLYHIYTPLELLFLSHVILSMLEVSKNSRVAIPIISVLVYLVCVFLGIHDMQGIDFNESMFSYSVLGILSAVAIMEGVKGWQWLVVAGVFIYSIINLVSYPDFHSEGNIIMNVFFLVALVKK